MPLTVAPQGGPDTALRLSSLAQLRSCAEIFTAGVDCSGPLVKQLMVIAPTQFIPAVTLDQCAGIHLESDPHAGSVHVAAQPRVYCAASATHPSLPGIRLPPLPLLFSALIAALGQSSCLGISDKKNRQPLEPPGTLFQAQRCIRGHQGQCLRNSVAQSFGGVRARLRISSFHGRSWVECDPHHYYAYPARAFTSKRGSLANILCQHWSDQPKSRATWRLITRCVSAVSV